MPVDGAAVVAGGAASFATHLQQQRAENPNTLSISNGDLVGGSPLLSALVHDEPTVEAMELLGLGIATVGNHEFDEGVDELRRITGGGCHPVDGCTREEEHAGSTATWLGANVVDRATGEPVLEPDEVRRYGGVRVGVIGVVLDETPSIVSAEGIRDVEFLDEVGTIDRYAAELQEQGVEAIVVSLHEAGTASGSVQTCEDAAGPAFDITRAVDDAVDVVLHGHSHDGYVCAAAQEVDGKLVTQALSNGRLLTDVDLTLDRRTGDVVAAAADNVVVTRDVPADPQVEALVQRTAELAAPVANRPVGRVTADITRTQEPLLDLAGESPLGNLVADAQLAATDDEAGAVAALMNLGGVRADLTSASSSAGEGDGVVTYGEAFAVQPFNDLLTTLTLSGEQLVAVLDQQFEVGRVLHPSASVRYAVDPATRRVVSGSLEIAGEPVVPARDYRITVNSFLAGGGNGFTTLTDGRDVVNQPGFDVDALSALLGSAPEGVAPPATDRIEVLPG